MIILLIAILVLMIVCAIGMHRDSRNQFWPVLSAVVFTCGIMVGILGVMSLFFP